MTDFPVDQLGSAFLSLAIRIQFSGLLAWGLYRLFSRQAGPPGGRAQYLLLVLLGLRLLCDLLTASLDFWPPTLNLAAQSRLLGISIAWPHGTLGLELFYLWIQLDQITAHIGALAISTLGQISSNLIGWLLLLGGLSRGIYFLVTSLQLPQTLRQNCRWSEEDQAYISPSSSSMAIGWTRPIVLLSQDHHRLPPAQRHSILLHERAHCQAYHPLTSWLLELLQAFLPFWSPLRWWTERVRQQMEFSADQSALNQGACPISLAKALLHQAQLAQAPQHSPAWSLPAQGSPLYLRIDRLLQPSQQNQQTPVNRWRLTIWALLLLGLHVL